MRPVVRRIVVATVCVATVVIAGCGKRVAANDPITFAPADTPYLIANFKRAPADAVAAWTPARSAGLPAPNQTVLDLAKRIAPRSPNAAAILDAMGVELASVHNPRDLAAATGFAWPALYAIYGIGDVPVLRTELASPDAFEAFWGRVEKRAGLAAPTATIEGQSYRLIGGDNAALHLLIAVEGKQLVATVAPAHASAAMLKTLLGLTKPAHDASDRLARIESRHGYRGDSGSGYLDLPRLFSNLFSGKDPVTQEFAKDLGSSLADPACATEFASLAQQVPMITAGMHTYSASDARGSVDAQLSPVLLGALVALKQPVPGMDAQSDNSMFDLVLALPLQKWQAFLEGRAQAAAAKAYRCPALQPLNRFAATAANPPVQMPPEAASLVGFRVVLDLWENDPTRIAGRALVASSNPAALAQSIQQTLPQFALKTITTDGKPVAFEIPPNLQPMFGGGTQGWIAANQVALAAGAGAGEDARLPGMLGAPAGNGDRMLRMHIDGRMYDLFGSWIGRFAAMAPGTTQAQIQQQTAAFQQLAKIVATEDIVVTLDAKGLHFEGDVRHR